MGGRNSALLAVAIGAATVVGAGALPATAGPGLLEAAQKRPKFPIVDPPVRVYFSVSDVNGPQEASRLEGRLKALRKELNPTKKKEWRWDWWLQLVDRPQDAEVEVALVGAVGGLRPGAGIGVVVEHARHALLGELSQVFDAGDDGHGGSGFQEGRDARPARRGPAGKKLGPRRKSFPARPAPRIVARWEPGVSSGCSRWAWARWWPASWP